MESKVISKTASNNYHISLCALKVGAQAVGGTSEGIELSVDDNEYSDFLGAENLEQKVRLLLNFVLFFSFN